jgi:hypothetical protein
MDHMLLLESSYKVHINIHSQPPFLEICGNRSVASPTRLCTFTMQQCVWFTYDGCCAHFIHDTTQFFLAVTTHQSG